MSHEPFHWDDPVQNSDGWVLGDLQEAEQHQARLDREAAEAKELRLLRELEKNRRDYRASKKHGTAVLADLERYEESFLAALDRHREDSEDRLPQCENPDHLVNCTCAAQARRHREGK